MSTAHKHSRANLQKQSKRKLLQIFESDFAKLCEVLDQQLDICSPAAETVIRHVQALGLVKNGERPVQLTIKLVAQWMVVRAAMGWLNHPQKHEFVLSLSGLVDANLRAFLDLVPDDNSTANDVACKLATIIQEFSGGRESVPEIDVTQRLISLTDKPAQKRLGMYFTPPVLVEFIIDRIASYLTQMIPISKEQHDSTALQSSEMKILEPALGSGEFVIALLQGFDSHSKFMRLLNDRQCTVVGYELHPVALLSCCFRIADYLARTNAGHESQMIGFQLQWDSAFSLLDPQQAGICQGFDVILGNPPFGSLQSGIDSRIESLIKHGTLDCQTAGSNDHSKNQSYFVDENGPINERKTWLYDLYVQFYRLAQYLIERNGSGLIGFVSNRGFLDNLTFRGMRYQLARSFQILEFTDLGGDQRNEKNAGDQNFFGIETPVAVAVCVKAKNLGSILCYKKVRGNLLGKKKSLAKDLVISQYRTCDRKPSGLPFVLDRRSSLKPSLPTLDQLMPYRGSPIITARDQLVVDFDWDHLRARILDFCDPSIPTSEFRSRYFKRSRSNRYPPGDTRSWKLDHVRANCENFGESIELARCHYRPFDHRWIAWNRSLIDWPRSELMNCISQPGNFALITRRQSPPECNWNYIWSSSAMVVDGIIRSDNRGNESVFPVWHKHQLNFESEFLNELAKRWSVKIRNELTANVHGRVNILDGKDVAAYLYGLFWSNCYRKRYADQLSSSYPVVPIVKEWETARQVINLGKKLLCLHHADCSSPNAENLETNEGSQSIHGKVEWLDEKVKLGQTVLCESIDEELWLSKIGSYQILRKWIRDRRGKPLTQRLLRNYQEVVRRLRKTFNWVNELDRCLSDGSLDS